MVNHIQTLLLNESAAVVQAELPESDYGYIDPSFRGVALDKAVAPVYGDLFAGAGDIAGKLRFVKLMRPYVDMPESRVFRDFFDPRIIDGRTAASSDGASGVFGFYRSMSEAAGPELPVPSVVGSANAAGAFGLSGVGSVDGLVSAAREVYEGSRETPVKFSMLVYAVALHLHAAYERGLR